MFPKKIKFIFKLKELFSDKISGETKREISLITLSDDTMTTNRQLRVSLKQLEFISFFEMHLDKRNEDSYSLSFLQELAEIKHTSQLNTIELIKSKSA
jgi:hypothetical protein